MSKSNRSADERVSNWHEQLLTRRRLLLAAAGGSLSILFPSISLSTAPAEKNLDHWSIIESVQQHLFPDEDDAPGAIAINALSYLKFIVDDETLDTDNRAFIIKGASWLEDMALQLHGRSFIKLNAEHKETVLRRIAGSEAGENWLSTLLLYIVEALLVDPVYGGNPDQVGWKWLKHVPGFPRPPENKTFMKLMS